jgi:hydrogenase expression/formation protein HypC
VCLAVPGEVIDVHEHHGMCFASVRFGAIRREVCLEYQKDARPGDFVLVHVGFAIARIDADQAADTWRVLEELGNSEEAELP